MTDIVERLRARKATWMDAIAVMEEAADEIEQLRAALRDIARRSIEAANEIERLTSALQEIASCEKRMDGDVVDIARAALEGK
jgi:chromosome segregation ATPase